MKLILASASPRRAELLKQLGLAFAVRPACVSEGKPVWPWRDWVLELAQAKALALPIGAEEVILAADTIVIKDKKVFGKPVDAEDAVRMLEQLSGSVHEVMTGVCVAGLMEGASSRISLYRGVEVTRVFFRDLTGREIKAYAETKEPLDKAGAYGIQGLGALFVERIEGCYFNVVGLPLVLTRQLLGKCGFEIPGGL